MKKSIALCLALSVAVVSYLPILSKSVTAASMVPFNPQIRTVVAGGITSPTNISNLYAWYKSDAGLLKTGVPVVDGDDATDWQNQSGNARHAVSGGTPQWQL